MTVRKPCPVDRSDQVGGDSGNRNGEKHWHPDMIQKFDSICHTIVTKDHTWRAKAMDAMWVQNRPGCRGCMRARCTLRTAGQEKVVRSNAQRVSRAGSRLVRRAESADGF